MQKQPLCYDDTLLSSHPVTLFKVMFGNPWVDRLDRGGGGLLFREQEPRNPLQEISAGDCILLLGDLGVFIFLVRKIVTRLITPLRLFCTQKSHTLYLIWRSPFLIYLNQSPLLFPRNQVFCLKYLKFWRALTTIEFHIFCWNFAHVFYLGMPTEECVGFF